MRGACVLLVVLLSLLSFAAAVDEVKVVSPPALKAMFGEDGLGMSSFFSPHVRFFLFRTHACSLSLVTSSMI